MGTLISVIMSTYNESEDYIRSSVSSILRQTLHDLELIIVIDNPENEAAVTAVNAFASEDSRVKILCNENNLGLVRSLNKAISAAHGEILARMDADDISLPQRLEKQLAFLRYLPSGSRFGNARPITKRILFSLLFLYCPRLIVTLTVAQVVCTRP